MNVNINHNNADLNNEYFSEKQNKKRKKEKKSSTKTNTYNLSNKQLN